MARMISVVRSVEPSDTNRTCSFSSGYLSDTVFSTFRAILASSLCTGTIKETAGSSRGSA